MSAYDLIKFSSFDLNNLIFLRRKIAPQVDNYDV